MSKSKEPKLELEGLRQRNEPLARVVEVLAMGKTARDDPYPVAQDIAIALEARDPKSALARALDEYERHNNIEIRRALVQKQLEGD